MQANQLLLERDREFLSHTIEVMFELCPDMMSRKIARANVQQAFIFFNIVNLLQASDIERDILCVGSFEDTAMESLIKMGYSVDGVDPQINMDLDGFMGTDHNNYDIVFATSVMEHVEDDEKFLENICKLLKPGGMAFLTCDFNNDYKPGDAVPATVVRQYTIDDLSGRLLDVLVDNGCILPDVPNWTGEPDFIYQGHVYCFASYVFMKV